MSEKASADVMLTAGMMAYYSRALAGSRDMHDPKLTPLFGKMERLPPFVIQVGTDEMLLDDSRRLAVRLRQAGVRVVLEEYPGMFHGFHMFSRFLGEANRAIERVGLFVKSCARPG